MGREVIGPTLRTNERGKLSQGDLGKHTQPPCKLGVIEQSIVNSLPSKHSFNHGTDGNSTRVIQSHPQFTCKLQTHTSIFHIFHRQWPKIASCETPLMERKHANLERSWTWRKQNACWFETNAPIVRDRPKGPSKLKALEQQQTFQTDCSYKMRNMFRAPYPSSSNLWTKHVNGMLHDAFYSSILHPLQSASSTLRRYYESAHELSPPHETRQQFLDYKFGSTSCFPSCFHG